MPCTRCEGTFVRDRFYDRIDEEGRFRLAGCGKSPSAVFSRRAEAHRTARVRFASSLAAALLDSLFAHPAG